MKKSLILVVAFMLLMAGMSFASTISSTKHNLSSAGAQTVRSNNVEQICVFCHTPHAANTSMTAAPLWNRTGLATSWGNTAAYSTTTLNNASTNALGSGDISKACLSCHDGNVGDETLVNGPGSGAGVTSPGWTASTFTTVANLNDSQGLKNDHPIGVRVISTGFSGADVNLKTPLDGNVRLYGSTSDVVECASCHKVHDNALPPFLAASMTGSYMCLQCHNK